jgi:hypothetical protein
MRPYNILGWAALAQESVSSTLVLCYSYKCPVCPSLERTRLFSTGRGWPYSATHGMSCESTNHLRRTGSFVSVTRLPIPL